VNVKEVFLTPDVESVGELRLQVVPGVLGPRAGAQVQQIIRAVREGRWSRREDGAVEVDDRVLADDEYSLRLVPRDGTAGRPLPGDVGMVALDVVLTPELEAEGLARDVARLVNEARKDAGLHVSDRIFLVVGAPPDVAAAVEAHRSYVGEQALATKVDVDVLPNGGEGRAYELADGRSVHVAVRRTGD
jgi:isoleucyl-tRNA synthetase